MTSGENTTKSDDWESLIATKMRPCSSICRIEDARKRNAARATKAWEKEYRQRPEVKAKRREYDKKRAASPERKAYERERSRRRREQSKLKKEAANE